jgi:hypothetical protein
MTESSEVNIKTEFQDCLSCRIWTGTFHIGAAAFVASQWNKQKHLGSKAFVLVFSTGKSLLRAYYAKGTLSLGGFIIPVLSL